MKPSNLTRMEGISNGTFEMAVSVLSNSNVTDHDWNQAIQSSLISDYFIQYVYTINMSIICAGFCLFGTVTNIINIVVFARQNFKETINIALMGLTISDLFSVVSLLFTAICFNPYFMYADTGILTVEIQHKTSGWTHIIFTRVTAFLTMYITLERCLCIAFPLKIKSMLTPKRVKIIVVAIYVVIIGTMGINFTYFRLEWKFVPSLNRTMFGMTFTDYRYIIQSTIYYVCVFYPVTSFTGVVACSIILVWKLVQRGRWLNRAVDGVEKSATRDRQVIKMVICVASIFIISFIPTVVLLFAMAVEPELNIGGKYENMYIFISSISLILEAINSSVNIFVYWKMNSKYAITVRTIMKPSKSKK